MKNYFISVLFVIGCNHYDLDELKVYNDTSGDIFYTAGIYGPKDSYISAAAGTLLKPKQTRAPTRRISIKTRLMEQSKDSTLYIIFYDSSRRNYVNTHLSHVFKDSSFFVMKLSRPQLDSLKWHIIYKGSEIAK